jgi:hypothetical protein
MIKPVLADFDGNLEAIELAGKYSIALPISN